MFKKEDVFDYYAKLMPLARRQELEDFVKSNPEDDLVSWFNELAPTPEDKRKFEIQQALNRVTKKSPEEILSKTTIREFEFLFGEDFGDGSTDSQIDVFRIIDEWTELPVDQKTLFRNEDSIPEIGISVKEQLYTSTLAADGGQGSGQADHFQDGKIFGEASGKLFVNAEQKEIPFGLCWFVIKNRETDEQFKVCLELEVSDGMWFMSSTLGALIGRQAARKISEFDLWLIVALDNNTDQVDIREVEEAITKFSGAQLESVQKYLDLRRTNGQ